MRTISKEQYRIWSWFLAHLCKIITCPDAFFQFFKILIFWVVRGVKGQKTVQNDKKSLCHAQYLKNHTSYDFHLWCGCVKWYLQMFFSMLKFWFSSMSSSVKYKECSLEPYLCIAHAKTTRDKLRICLVKHFRVSFSLDVIGGALITPKIHE